MARVRFDKVTKCFDTDTYALRDFSLDIEDGEFVVLVGPSGCGKSTALRLLAGLEQVSEGQILIDDELVNQVSPQQRNTAMVFQNYALYPHMSVRGNLEFPLKMAHLGRQQLTEKVEEIARILDLTALLERKPKQLSGGQRQRVAMGRALVRNPSVFLLDEPLSNLDAKLRAQIRADIAKLQRRLHKTTLYVTHDQVEAMTLGDRVAVINEGKLQQVGTPEQLYTQPQNTFVARFIGSPGMNIISSSLVQKGDDVVIRLGESEISLSLSGIRNEIPAVVEDALAGFELDTGFDIPPPVDMRLEMSSGLDMIQFSGPAGSGYGQLGLYGQVYPQARGSGIDPGARGAIRKDGALPTFSSNPDDYLFGLGLKDDFFNQILWALWYGGGLDLDEADLAPLLGAMAGVSLTFKAELPPVAMPGRGGNQIEIGLGDVRIDATVDLDALFGGSGGAGVLNVGLYLSSVVGATLSTVDTTDPSGNPITELRVAWEQEPEIYVQVVSIDDPGYQGLMSDIFKQVLELLLPSLLGSVLESFPIPEFDLSGIGGLPPGTVWRLTGTTVDRDGAYFRITGSLQ